MNTVPTIVLVEPDPAICESVRRIACVLEVHCNTYATGTDFLDAFDNEQAGCLVLEIAIPGVNGLQIQHRLRALNATLPIIFLTASASVSIAVHTMRMGAFHFLEKPFHEHDLWTAIQQALQVDQKRREAKSIQAAIDARLGTLSEKELAVLELVAQCKSKEAIAAEMGVSIRTIEHHRTQLMRKLKTNSIAGLVRFALTMNPSDQYLLNFSTLSDHDGNGFDHRINETVLHNGHYASQASQAHARRRNPK
jgi:two-component system response regulator DctR